MIGFSEEQLSQFKGARKDAFSERLVDFLTAQFPDALQIERTDLIKNAQYSIERSEEYSMRNEDEIATFFLTCWVLGLDFDTEFPAATTVLQDPDCPPAEKARWLERWVMEMLKSLENG
jgi:hypothetical protein